MKRSLNIALAAIIALLAPFAQAVTPEDKAALISEAEALIESQRAVDEAVAAYKSKLYGLKLDDPTVAPAWKSAVGWEAAQPLYRNLRDTMLGHLRSIEPTEPPVVVEPDPDPVDPPDPDPVDPDPIEPTAISIFIDAEGGPSWGNDTNDGMTAGSPVATIARAKVVAWEIVKANPGAVVAFRFRRGDTFGAFGPINCTDPSYADNPNDWHHLRLSGTEEQPLVIAGYGEGERPKLADGFTMKREQSNVEVRGIEVTGGNLVFAIGTGRNLRIIDNVGRNASIVVQGSEGNRFTGLEIRRNVIRDVISPAGDRQGAFINRVDAWSMTDNVFFRCGWIKSEEGVVGAFRDFFTGEWLKLSIRNHGVYVTGDCSKPIECDRNYFLYNSATGIQLRPGGPFRGNVVAGNGRNGVNCGATFGGNSDMVPGTADVTGNLIDGSAGVGGALTLGDLGSGRIANNLIWPGSMNIAISVTALHGENSYGGWWFGINNTVIENNRLDGDIELQSDGWGKLPEYVVGVNDATGLLVRTNALAGKMRYDDFDPDPNKQFFLFADPDGKVVVQDEAGQKVESIGVAPPVFDAATLDLILSGELGATEFIEQHWGGD